MQKIPLHAKEMTIGLIDQQKSNWIQYVVFAVIIIAIILLTKRSDKRDADKQ